MNWSKIKIIVNMQLRLSSSKIHKKQLTFIWLVLSYIFIAGLEWNELPWPPIILFQIFHWFQSIKRYFHMYPNLQNVKLFVCGRLDKSPPGDGMCFLRTCLHCEYQRGEQQNSAVSVSLSIYSYWPREWTSSWLWLLTRSCLIKRRYY